MSSLDSLNSKREEASNIVNDILDKSKELERRLEESTKIISKIISNSKDSDTLNSSLKSTIASTSKTIERFRTERQKVYSILHGVNSFYEKKYLPLLDKINDKNNGFQSKLNASKKDTDEISKYKAIANEQLSDLKKIASELKPKYAELKKLDGNIRKLEITAKKDSDSIKISSDLIKSLEVKIRKANAEISILFNESDRHSKSIKSLLDNSNRDISNIKKNNTESDKILEDIQKIYELAAQTGLSGEFERQKKQLGEQLTKWEQRIFNISSVLLLLIIALFLLELALYDWKLKNIDVNFYLRFILFSPIVFYLYFCTNQFSEAKKLHDKYAFKTTLAMSIQNHIKMLLEQDGFAASSKEKITEFVISAFQKIYSEPYMDNTLKLGIKLQNIEMNLEKKLEEKLKEVKQDL